jgi:hypothetical protein
MSDILVEQYDHLVQEIETCRDVTKRLERSVEMVQQAAKLAKERRAGMIATQQRRVAQLESLRNLIWEKEEEVSRKNMVVIPNFLTISFTASQFTTG